MYQHCLALSAQGAGDAEVHKGIITNNGRVSNQGALTFVLALLSLPTEQPGSHVKPYDAVEVAAWVQHQV